MGETLTADVSGIDDADGLTNVSYRYQWLAGGSDIEDATGSSHLLTASQQGQTVHVKVTFTDDADNQESLTSAETLAVAAKPNTAAAGEPTISGTPQVEQTLTADTSGISDANGLNNVSYQYQWLRDNADIAGQTNSTYRLVSADEGKTIRVRVTFNDDAGNAESLTSTATTPIAAQPAETPVDLLTASFANVPADHNGENFTFQLTFSENVNAGYARIRDDAFTVSGGAIASASRQTQGSNQGWNVEVNPTGNEAITITLPETTDCDDTGAICTGGGKKLSGRVELTVNGPEQQSQEQQNNPATGDPAISGTPRVGETLTAETSGIRDADGLTNATYNYQWVAGASDISGATASSYLLTSSEEGQTIRVRVTFRDDADNAESLTSMATTAVAARPTPAVLLTASFPNVPADHNGSKFTFQLNFSENVDAGYARIQNDAFTVSGGSISSASRITQGSNQGWNVEVNPTGNEAITITLPETTDCNAARAICTDDERMLSHTTSVRVAGPPAISVSDANVQEAEGATLAFSVTLSHAYSRTVTVDYATQDGTATAGSDYTASNGSLTFNPDDTSQTVSVTVLTDSEDESEETLTLTISNPSQATLDDATATGTIEDGESSSGTQEDPPVALLTATFSNLPAEHNGNEFTFDLSFSENVEAGYERIRDDAFNVTGGEIANAQRKTQGSNQNWTITVRPDGNAAMTITLPPTTDCGSAGAICTHDGRKLSDSTSAQVAGPE